MFKKVIGKTCRNHDGRCELAGQAQDEGLAICPSCGLELEILTVDRTREKVLVMSVLALVGTLSGLSGYGLLAKGLDPLRTVKWAVGRIELNPSFSPSDAGSWMEGEAVFYDARGKLATQPGDFLIEKAGGKRTSTFHGTLPPEVGLSFDLTTVDPSVSSVYLLHRGDNRGRVFATDLAASRQEHAPLSIPGENDVIRFVPGAATEHFVLVLARKALPTMEALRRTATAAAGEKVESVVSTHEVDEAIGKLEQEPDTYVLHVDIPHS